MMYRLRTTAILFLLLLASFGVAQNNGQAVLGTLGQALETTPIFATANTKGRVYYRVKAYEHIVILPHNERWHKVLMSNGIYAFIPADKVAQLPFEVLGNRPSQRGGSTVASRSGNAAGLAQYATRYTGTPYVWGGNDMNNGIDCSGFVKQLFGKIGVSLPRTAAEQALVGKPITRLEDLRPGDRLYFWEAKRNKIGHTGIYLGNGYFVHSSRGRGGVGTDALTERWLKILVAARR
jgi:cell wall-associated NlpC family hydrolase